MSKAYVLGFIAGLALLLVVGAAGFQLQSDLEKKKYQAELLDATPVQFRVLTERQRIHSKLYSNYRQRTKTTMSEFVAQAKSKMIGIELHVGLDELLTEPETPESYFGKLVDASDAVIRGRVANKVSQITEDDAFIFTDYDVEVKQVLKNNATSPVNTGTTITVTHPGGKIVVNGIIVNVKDDYFTPLPINNDIVLFLKFVSETGAYKLTRHTGSFELDGKVLHPLTEVHFPPGVLQDGDSFLRTVGAISNK